LKEASDEGYWKERVLYHPAQKDIEDWKSASYLARMLNFRCEGRVWPGLARGNLPRPKWKGIHFFFFWSPAFAGTESGFPRAREWGIYNFSQSLIWKRLIADHPTGQRVLDWKIQSVYTSEGWPGRKEMKPKKCWSDSLDPCRDRGSLAC
jgi:hypothetical protein